MSLFRFIPHLLTLSNLLCGSIAVCLAVTGDLASAALFILAGAFFDFFDGFAARLLKVAGPLGKELDSLADVVTFGLAPSVIAVVLNFKLHGESGNNLFEWSSIWLYLPLIMVAFSAFRLAKFNIDTRQSDRFIGLPTPANAIFWVALAVLAETTPPGFWNSTLSRGIANFLLQPIMIDVWAVALSILMVSEIPMLALKFKDYTWSHNKLRFLLIIGAIILIALLGFGGIPIVLFLYLILSFADSTADKRNGIQGQH